MTNNKKTDPSHMTDPRTKHRTIMTFFRNALLTFGTLAALGSGVLCLKTAPAYSASVETIVAVVNNDAVSASDLAARAKLIMGSSGLPDTPEIREKLKPQIINTLIEERLMAQEAQRLKITVSKEDIDKGFQAIASQNNMTAEQFMAVLTRQGIPLKTLQSQIASQLAWTGVIQTKIRPDIEITDNQVDIFFERLKADQGKAQYLVSEIFLPVDSPSDDSNIKQLADKLTAQLVEGRVPFPRLASQFSQAAGAGKGGDLGWVQEGQMPQEIDSMLSQMQEGELSKPIRTLTGYHIVYLRKKSVLNEQTMPSRDTIYQKLGTEELERQQRRHLLDLKAAAFIENRV